MSSHREAPEIAKDPVADSTDVYAFVSPDAPDTVTLIVNYVPFENPDGGPNFYEFGNDVLYEINIDNDGDARPDVTYQFQFTTRITNPNTFLYNTGPITSLTSPALESSPVLHCHPRRPPRQQACTRPAPCLPAVQHRSTVDSQLRDARQRRDPLAARRPASLRGPARRPVLRRRRIDLRPAQPAPVAEDTPGRQHLRQEPAGRQRARSDQRAQHRPAGADLRRPSDR